MFDGVKIFMKITKNRSEKFLVKEQLPLKVLSTLLKEPFKEILTTCIFLDIEKLHFVVET